MHQWIVLLHVIGAFVFVASHGVAIWMASQIARERDPRRIAAMLDLSSASLNGVYGGLLVLLIGGIWAAIDGGFFARAWPWVALGVLIAIVVGMYVVATPYFRRLRGAVGVPPRYGPKDQPVLQPSSDAEVAALAAQSPVMPLMVIGAGGLAIILWLMILQPF
jgi:hypothetical protein